MSNGIWKLTKMCNECGGEMDVVAEFRTWDDVNDVYNKLDELALVTISGNHPIYFFDYYQGTKRRCECKRGDMCHEN